MKQFKSHGDGVYSLADFKSIGENCVIEEGVLVFHADSVSLGRNIYIGHNSILKGYFKNEMVIGDNTWVGQCCFFHSAGGLFIGEGVGIAPYVKIITSQHCLDDPSRPVLDSDLIFEEVNIGSGADVGVGVIILPGVTIGDGAVIGAGSVVTKDVPAFAVAAGSPAKVLRYRKTL